MGIKYRANQFFHTLTAQPSERDLELVDELLSPDLATLFREMPHADQSHSLGVYSTIIQGGETSVDLLTAALLHDVGKSRAPLKPWDRTIVVLTKALFPTHLERWGVGKPHGWRKPFVVHVHHPDWGAQMVAEHGGSEVAVYLIRHHHDILAEDSDDSRTHLLKKLQKADGIN